MSDTNIICTRQQKSVIAKSFGVSPEELEEINVKTSTHKKASFRDDFSLIFKGNITTPARMKLTPTSFKIVIYLFSILDYGNILVNFSQAKIAKELGLCKSNVSRAFRDFFDKKYCSGMLLMVMPT